MPGWTIACDFDGTVSVGDVTDLLLERYGRPGWEELETAWQHGEIGSRACMAGQIALLDMSPAQLDAAIDRIRIDPDFPAFVRAALGAGVPVTIVSDGLDLAIRSILARHDLDMLPIVANRLEPAGPRRFRLEFPHSNPGCHAASGTCKCDHVARERVHHPRVLLIGDGTSDFCAAGSVDFVFAKSKLIQRCREQGLPHLPIRGFADALVALPALLVGELAGASAISPLFSGHSIHARN
ncbi:MAG TPA: HAD-IB family phosphatase [Rhodanobacteraceae bacterium]|nr:HAD-IB family phosphatase [Rhodanobacteraceae bacterium]